MIWIPPCFLYLANGLVELAHTGEQLNRTQTWKRIDENYDFDTRSSKNSGQKNPDEIPNVDYNSQIVLFNSVIEN